MFIQEARFDAATQWCDDCGGNGIDNNLNVCHKCDGKGKVERVVFSEIDAHRKRNFDLCDGINMIKLSIVIDKMVEDGLHPRLAEIYNLQAGALLAALRSENNRNFKR